MSRRPNNNLTVPGALVEFALKKGLAKELKLLLCMKLNSSGWLPKKLVLAPQMKASFGCGDNRTMAKYTTQLVRLGWVGSDEVTDRLYPRSWEFLLSAIDASSRRYFLMQGKEFRHTIEFFISITMDMRLRRIRGYHLYKSRSIRKSKNGGLRGHFASNLDGAYQKFLHDPPPYFGLSNETIGKMANRSKSWGSMIKARANALGYIRARNRFFDLGHFAPYPGLRADIARAYPDSCSAVSLKRVGDKILVRAQLHDEITSQLVSVSRD